MSAAAVATTMPAALSDPKIILHVLSLLQRRDLLKGASSVCRAWYILARPLLYPTGFFWLGKIPLTRHYILEDLRGIQTLPVITSTSAHYYIRPIRSNGEFCVCAGHWSELQTQIRELLVKDPESHFQELVISGALDLNVEALEPVRLFSTSLTSVRIENTWMDTIAVAAIVESCPLLMQLEIESTFRGPTTGVVEVVQSVVQRGAVKEESIPAGMLLPEGHFTTALTQLSLSGIRIQFQSLKRLLLSCRQHSNSPGLLDLTLKQVMIEEPFSAPGTAPERSLDQQQTLNSIHTWCPALRSLHFSMMGPALTQLDQAQLFKRFAEVPNWEIPHSDLLPSTFLSLQAYVNNVTTLKLTCSCDGLAPLTLHEYLCNSPQLRNLAIKKIMYPAEYMDLEPLAVNKAGFFSPRYCQDESSTPEASKSKSSDPTSLTLWLQRRVWACRELETLQIRVDGLVGDTRAARNSRVMFAYIALVCPHLRELRITRDKMNMQLEGGLCYLGALEDLQVLILQTTHIQVKHVSDIEWMRQTSASASATAAVARARRTMGSVTGSNRITRLDTDISRATTRSTLASRRSLPSQKSKTWVAGKRAHGGVWSKVVGRIFESGTPRLFRSNEGNAGLPRTKTISNQEGDLGQERGHARAGDEKKILQRLVAMYRPEGISKAVERMERRKTRAEGRRGREDDEVGYCWPDMELFVVDAAKYSGISSEALMTTVGGFRTDIVFQALSLYR
ncbi:hypothetical protein EC968_007509 [Mortierella alpina]|nr:hypothetical protein EC968_007509 [Mortierella alpina]